MNVSSRKSFSEVKLNERRKNEQSKLIYTESRINLIYFLILHVVVRTAYIHILIIYN